MKYGDKFTFPKEKSFEFFIEADTPLIFIYENKQNKDFMYCSRSGQHNRSNKALKYCKKVKDSK